MANRIFIIAVFGVLTLILPVAYAFGGDTGQVGATVSVIEPACITINTSTVQYGSAAFSSTQANVDKTGSVTITSCTGSAQKILAKGANAAQSAGGAAAWTLGAVACPTLDTFSHFVNDVQMTTTSADITTSTITNAAQVNPSTKLRMPCVGSSGAGALMTTTLTFTAILQ